MDSAILCSHALRPCDEEENPSERIAASNRTKPVPSPDSCSRRRDCTSKKVIRMKSIFALIVATSLAFVVPASAGRAQGGAGEVFVPAEAGTTNIEILPPDFVLFGMTSGDYCAEYHQQTLPASTNEDHLFPNAGPFSNE